MEMQYTKEQQKALDHQHELGLLDDIKLKAKKIKELESEIERMKGIFKEIAYMSKGEM